MQKSTTSEQTQSGIQPVSSDNRQDNSQLTLATLYEQLASSERGLTTQQAENRLKKFGPNEPATVHRMTVLRQFFSFLANPLVIILLLASLVSAALGEVIAS